MKILDNRMQLFGLDEAGISSDQPQHFSNLERQL